MKLEALLAALCLQLSQVGVRKVADSPSTVACECHCDCPPVVLERDWSPILGAGSLGACSALLGVYCCGSSKAASLPPSPRRRGHGILEYPAWSGLGGLLQR